MASNANPVNIELDQGASKNIQYIWEDPISNLPLDVSGYTAKMQIRRRPADDTLLLELSTANTKIVLGGAQGTITVMFSPTDTSAGDWFNAFYDLFITKISDGTNTRIAKGFVTILHSVTQ